ncbi:hypothetical protein [Oligoflexus sp.]|uniref:hypothetical protein n=1 Tax=Oligoflexus sp. TaxID=1971216 RepID=UPI002D789DA9|nr:hypothetical protein [Oligoflexus sp.]
MSAIAALVLSSSLTSCQKDEEEKEGNAILVMDAYPEKAIEGQDMTLNRIRVWLSAPNGDGPGVVTLVDMYEVEIWATLSGEEKSRYQNISGLKADAEGNLYSGFVNNQPGTTIFRPNSTGIDQYTLTATDGLLTSLFPRYHTRINEAVITSAGTTYSNSDFDVSQIQDGPWTNFPSRVATELYTRIRYVENVDFATKAKMACFVKSSDGTDVNQGTYILGAIELGTAFKGPVVSQVSTSGDASGDDDKMWITYQDSWYLTGLNIQNLTIRTYRVLAAPYYLVRELPGVDTDQTAPRISGAESLLRACNTAANASGGTFSFLLGATIDGMYSSQSAPHCAALQTASADPSSAAAIPLSGYLVSAGGNSCDFSTGALGLTAGTWNGSAHPIGSSVSSPLSSAMYRTATSIVETALQ